MRALLVALSLVPSLGLAQSLVLTVSGSPVAKNAGGCGDGVAGVWTGTTLTNACAALQIWLTINSACGSAPSTTNSPPDLVVATVQSAALVGGQNTGSFNFAFNTLPSFSTSGVCGTANLDFTNYVCASVTTNSATNTCDGPTATAQSIPIRYDTVPPPSPAVQVTSLDSKLSVRLTATGSAPNDVQYFILEYAVATTDGGAPDWVVAGNNIPNNGSPVTISGLTNDTTYEVRATSIDEAGNPSDPSDPVAGVPLATLGFFSNYIALGGQETGCGAAGGAPSIVGLSLLLLLLVSARRRG